MTSSSSSSSSSASPPNPGFFRRNRDLLKQWLLFLGIIGVLVGISQWAHTWVNDRFSEVTARWVAFFLRLGGLDHVRVIGRRVSCSACSLEIIGECTAYFPCAIFAAAVLAHPAPIRRRLLGVLLGVPALLLVNQVRLLSLCYVFRAWPSAFETIHVVVWQSLIIVIAVLFWTVWASTLGRAQDEKKHPQLVIEE